jgi:hypothetical protein
VKLDPDGGIAKDGPQVQAFLKWLVDRNAKLKLVEFVCTPYDAAAILASLIYARDD